jgi:CheY-like chemotaxis protein
MRKIKLLIAENDEDENMFMVEGFSESGLFELLASVETGDEVLQYLDTPGRQLPDLILTDMNMPGKTGLDILQYIKNQPELSQIPVIVLSTSSTRSVINKCMQAGAHSYLVKPDTFMEYGKMAESIYQKIKDEIFT